MNLRKKRKSKTIKISSLRDRKNGYAFDRNWDVIGRRRRLWGNNYDFCLGYDKFHVLLGHTGRDFQQEVGHMRP